MFEFGTLISILITLILGYISLHFTFRHQLDEIKFNNKNDNESKYEIIKQIKFVNFFFPILIIIVIFLYFLPDIKIIYTQTDFEFVTKIFPFKIGFFDNKNFKFSYITGLILSIIVIILLIIVAILVWWDDIKNKIIASTIIIFITLITSYGLIWTNYYISTFFDYCITHYFELFSIVLNILSYAIIFLALYLLCFFIDFVRINILKYINLQNNKIENEKQQ